MNESDSPERRSADLVFDQHPFLLAPGPHQSDLAAFYRRHGGQITQSVPWPEREQRPVELIDFAHRLLVAEIDLVVLLTAGGVEWLFESLRPFFDLQRIAHALSDGRTICTSFHTAAALDSIEVAHTVLHYERPAWRDLLVALEGAMPLANCTLAIEQTVHSVELSAGLESRGARVIELGVLGRPLRRALGRAEHAADDEPWPTTVYLTEVAQLHAVMSFIRGGAALGHEDILVMASNPLICQTADHLGFRVRLVEVRDDVREWDVEAARELARHLW